MEYLKKNMQNFFLEYILVYKCKCVYKYHQLFKRFVTQEFKKKVGFKIQIQSFSLNGQFNYISR